MNNIFNFTDFVNEGRSSYDSIASKLVKHTFKKWVNSYKGGEATLNFTESLSLNRMLFDVDFNLHVTKQTKGFEVLDSTGADSRTTDDDGDYQDPYIIIDLAVNPDWIPGEWSTIYFYLADIVRHEIEHITQDGDDVGNYRPGKPNEDDSELRLFIKMGLLPNAQYFMLPKEVDANLQGLRYEAKKRKESMTDAVNRYLDTQEQSGTINGTERDEIIELWRRRAKQIGGIPKF